MRPRTESAEIAPSDCGSAQRIAMHESAGAPSNASPLWADVALALMRAPHGATGEQLQTALGDPSPTVTMGRIGRLVRDGLAFSVRHSKTPRRYFDSKARADAWLAAQPGRGNFSGKPRHRREPAAGQKLTLAKAKLAPKPEGDVQGMDVAPRTYIPAPLGRYDLGPDDKLTAGFSSARPGINPLTGQGWEQRA